MADQQRTDTNTGEELLRARRLANSFIVKGILGVVPFAILALLELWYLNTGQPILADKLGFVAAVIGLSLATFVYGSVSLLKGIHYRANPSELPKILGDLEILSDQPTKNFLPKAIIYSVLGLALLLLVTTAYCHFSSIC